MLGVAIDLLTPSELQAFATAELENAVSNIRLQELLPDHPVEISRMLTRLCERGLLVSDNRRRWATYRIGAGDKVPSLFDQTDSSHKDKDSIHLGGDSIHLRGDSSHLEKDSSHLNEVNVELQKIAEPVSNKGKTPVTLVREVICCLCTSRYLTAEELSRLLNRSQNNIRNRYLTLMVAEGLLTLRYPDSVNRPGQAYTATNKDAQ